MPAAKPRTVMRRRAVWFAVLCASLPSFPASAFAQARFDANYTLSMAGISIGKLSWRAQIGSSDYTTNANGKASGVFRLLISGEGNVTVKGAIKDGRPLPASFVSAVARDDEKSSVQMTLDAGKVRDLKIEEPPPESDRVPISDAHKHDIIDPLSAFLIPAAPGDPLQASACQRVLSIFDGRRRYDLALSYRRLDKARPEKGYSGPALVCGVKFTPIAGHRASSPLVKFLSEGRDIEAWFVPVAGTRVLAPVRISVASALGNMILRADQFETSPAVGSGKP